jgi:Ca2+-binding EF-hand superfamily protein
MMMIFARTVFAPAALALACGAGYAADADKERENKAHKGFNEMDKNADGKLTRAEAAGNKDLLAKWKNADSNNDGVLTRSEYLTVMAKKDANTVKQAVNKEVDEAKRRAPDASTGSSSESKSK